MKLNEMYKQIGERINGILPLDVSISLKSLSSKLEKEFLKEDINNLLTYLIIKDFLKIERANKDFFKSEVRLIKKIDIESTEKSKSLAKLVMSLPPYDKFGVKKELDSRKIDYESLEDSFMRLLNSAEHTVEISSPFLSFYNISAFQKLLLRKAKEKVMIKILTRQMFDEEQGPRCAELRNFYKLVKDQNLSKYIEIRDYHFSKDECVLSSTHSKLLIIDNKEAYVGSGELRYNSFNKNFELGIIVSEQLLVKDIRNVFDIIFSRAQKMS